LAVILALISSGFYGAADFLGGFATKRVPTIAVLVLSGSVGIATALVAIAILPAVHPQPVDLGWGVAAGLIGGGGLYLFYYALGVGVMSVIAPVAAVTSIAVPVLVGLASGERPGALPLIGVLLAVLAIACVSITPGAPAEPVKVPGSESLAVARTGTSSRDLWSGVASGIAFGFFYVLIHRASPAAGMWPLVAARGTSVSGWALIALATARSLKAPRPTWPILASAGSLDMIANILCLLALQRGMLSVVATLASLYPTTTLILARLVLRERLGPVQGVGLAVATAAVVLISAG
jgi:drug/metabolite transporter (DMT)-like permease